MAAFLVFPWLGLVPYHGCCRRDPGEGSSPRQASLPSGQYHLSLEGIRGWVVSCSAWNSDALLPSPPPTHTRTRILDLAYLCAPVSCINARLACCHE